ncbi:MAG: DegV family protein [Oscillospiraceae bacterium]|nr:DegV family protein [Oscillospiraceae bacterium]
MNERIFISADSSCDLSGELLRRFDIRTQPMTITLGNETFLDGDHFTPEDMYRRYRAEGILPLTSAPSVQDYVEFFRAMRTAGGQVVHLTISSELSASYNTARLAAEELDGVYVVDSRQLSTGVGLLAIEGAECRDRGMDAAAIAEHLRGLTDKVETSFVLDTLEFMRKGGRCSNFAALGANLLKLKPALEMRGGKLNVYKKYRGNIDRVYREYIAERLAGKRIRPGHVFLTDSGGVDAALLRELEALVRALIPVREVHHTYAGCTVSTHCGPKTLGVLFLDE